MDILSHLSEKKYTVQYFKVWKEGFIESIDSKRDEKVLCVTLALIYGQFQEKMYMYSHLLV